MTWDLNTLSSLTGITEDNNNPMWKGGETDEINERNKCMRKSMTHV